MKLEDYRKLLKRMDPDEYAKAFTPELISKLLDLWDAAREYASYRRPRYRLERALEALEGVPPWGFRVGQRVRLLPGHGIWGSSNDPPPSVFGEVVAIDTYVKLIKVCFDETLQLWCEPRWLEVVPRPIAEAATSARSTP